MSDVELRVKSGLKAILDEMDSIRSKVEEVDKTFQDMGKTTSDEVKKKTKETETFLGNLQGFGRRVADQLKRDFKALASVESLTAGLKISEQFKNSVSETITLSNTIRKLGATFGIAGKDFAKFQEGMSRGLGEIGLSSDAAARALEGLSQTPVRGDKNLLDYSKKAGQLAMIGREPGREEDIARSLAKVLIERGGNPNDLKAMNELAESVRRVTIQTQQKPSDVLSGMQRMYTSMPQDFRKSMSPGAMAGLSAANHVAGANAGKFIEEILGANPAARLAFEARGGRNLFSDKGLDVDKFKSVASSILGRIGFDPRASAMTLNLSPDAAEGFIRFSETLEDFAREQKAIRTRGGSIDQSQRESMGLGESFKANINKVKGNLSGILEPIIQRGTDMLSKASESDLGATGVVAGGGLLAALLTGGGIRGIGKAAGTLGKGAIAEKVTGQKTVPVYVTNAGEIGLGAGVPGSGAMGTAGKVLGAAGLAVTAGVAAREATAWVQEKTGVSGPSAQDSVDWAQEAGGDNAGLVMEKLTNALITLNNMLGANYALTSRKQKMDVTITTERGLKATQEKPRGEIN